MFKFRHSFLVFVFASLLSSFLSIASFAADESTGSGWPSITLDQVWYGEMVNFYFNYDDVSDAFVTLTITGDFSGLNAETGVKLRIPSRDSEYNMYSVPYSVSGDTMTVSVDFTAYADLAQNSSFRIMFQDRNNTQSFSCVFKYYTNEESSTVFSGLQALLTWVLTSCSLISSWLIGNSLGAVYIALFIIGFAVALMFRVLHSA